MWKPTGLALALYFMNTSAMLEHDVISLYFFLAIGTKAKASLMQCR